MPRVSLRADIALEYVAAACPALQELNLELCGGVTSLAPLLRMHGLTALNATRTAVDDTSLEQLRTLGGAERPCSAEPIASADVDTGLPALRCLGLSGTAISDVGLAHLAGSAFASELGKAARTWVV
jgi:hypothetical protein